MNIKLILDSLQPEYKEKAKRYLGSINNISPHVSPLYPTKLFEKGNIFIVDKDIRPVFTLSKCTTKLQEQWLKDINLSLDELRTMLKNKDNYLAKIYYSDDYLRFLRVEELIAEAIAYRLEISKQFNSRTRLEYVIHRAISTIVNKYVAFNINNEMQKIDAESTVYFKDTSILLPHSLRKLQVNISQNRALEVAHLLDGCKVKAGKLIGKPTSNYSKSFSWNPLAKYTSSNRFPVMRGLKMYSSLLIPDPPFIRNNIDIYPPSRNVLTARMYWKGYTHEDGCVMSHSCSKKFFAIEKHTDRFSGVSFLSVDRGQEIYPGMKIGVSLVDDEARIQTTSIKSKANITDIVDEFDGKIHNIEVVSTYPSHVELGSKFADTVGNKFTVSLILPDKDMPKININGEWKNVDLITNPKFTKRGAPVNLEEKLSILTMQNDPDNELGEIIIEDNTIDLNEVVKDISNIHECVDSRGKYNVAGGYRRIVRLNHEPHEKARVIPFVKYDKYHRVDKGISITDPIYTMYASECTNLINEVYKPNSKLIDKTNLYLNCLGYTLTPNGLSKYKSPVTIRHILNNIKTADLMNEINIEGTLYDKKLEWKLVDIDLGMVKIWDYDKLRANKISIYNLPYSILRAKEDPKDYKITGKITVPIEPVYKDDNGIISLNKLQGLIMNITNNIQYSSYNRVINQLSEDIYLLKQELRSRVQGKSGLLRGIAYSKVPGISAVLKCEPTCEINEVQIPYKFVKILSRNKDIAKIYRISSSMPFSEMKAKLTNKLVLFWRDPAHQRRNNNAMKIVLSKDRYTIGINPLVFKLIDGDDDGDMGQVYFARTTKGYHDLNKLLIEDVIDNEYEYPDMYKGNIKAISEYFRDQLNSIDTTVYSDINIPKDCKKIKEYHQLMKGLSKPVVKEHQSTAAYQYHILKFGVAQGGGVGMDIRNLIMNSDISLLKECNILYHNLAQSALDSKNGLGNKLWEEVSSKLKADNKAENFVGLLPDNIISALSNKKGDIVDIRVQCQYKTPLFNLITARSFSSLLIEGTDNSLVGKSLGLTMRAE